MDNFYNLGHHSTATIFDADEEVRIKFVDVKPPLSQPPRGTILLIHGFPQSSYQFRKVIPLLSRAGYRLVIPDYRGTGSNNKPAGIHGYRKTRLATDLHELIRNHLAIQEKAHVVGHDIGGMIAHAYAMLFPDDTASVIWGECPLPGTSFYDESKGSVELFHFTLHRVLDLPEALIAGREQIYLQHFFDKISHNPAGITPADVDFYVRQYSLPGSMRAAINVYRTFEIDKKENLQMRAEKGKSLVPCLILSGAKFFLAETAQTQAEEFYLTIETAVVEDAGHYIAEENAEGFATAVSRFLDAFS